MPGHFTKIEVADPRLFAQAIWDSLPPSEKASLTELEFSSQEWAPLDQRYFRIEPESYRTELSIANIGALRLSRTVNNHATQMTVRSPGIDGFGISMVEHGASRLVLPETDEPAIGNATTGLIYSADPGVRATASDSQSRLLVRLTTCARVSEAISRARRNWAVRKLSAKGSEVMAGGGTVEHLPVV